MAACGRALTVVGTFANIGSKLPQTTAIGSIALDETTGGFPNLYVGTGEDNHCFDCYYGQGIFRFYR